MIARVPRVGNASIAKKASTSAMSRVIGIEGSEFAMGAGISAAVEAAAQQLAEQLLIELRALAAPLSQLEPITQENPDA